MFQVITLTVAILVMGLGDSLELSRDRQPETYKADMHDVHFWLWTRSNPGAEDFYELIINDVANLLASPFDASLPTHVLAHGWNTNSSIDWPIPAKAELLKYHDCNVIAIEWGKIAFNINYLEVVNDVREVGHHSASFLDYLHSEGGLDITSLYAAGHSLGAHLVGFMGADVIHGPIRRITGLDPAGPEYHTASNDERLDKSDATFVDIIHTNSCPLLDFCKGLEDPLGHVDYFPNGGEHQPGSTPPGEEWMNASANFTSHGLSHEYWIESINGVTPFTSFPCADWETYEAGGCPDCGQGCLDMGMHASTELLGLYFLKTNDKPPYALG